MAVKDQRGQSRLNSSAAAWRRSRIQTTLPLPPLLGAILIGCGAASADDRASPKISVELNRTPQVVEVRGLDHATLRRLGQLKPNDSAWSRRVAVYVEGGTYDSTPTPPVT